MTKDLVEEFEGIIKEFDFNKVHEVMRFLNWHWASGGLHIPEIEEMKSFCFDLFDDALREYLEFKKAVTVSCGGFDITILDDETIYLAFVVASGSN
jgi:hypothetical protein